MTIDEIKKLIAKDETRTLELKKTTGELHRGMETACAFLSNPRKTWRVLFQRLLMPDSPTMTPEQGRAPLATSRKTDFPSPTQEAP